MGVLLAVNLKELFERNLDDRSVALYTAWLLVRAKDPATVKQRIFGDLDGEHNVIARAYRVLVEQYCHFMAPLYDGRPPFLLYEAVDKAFSESKQWRSMKGQGFVFEPPEED